MTSAEMAAPQRRLFYIAGYGRSGSTLLGRLMAENEDVLYLGEVVLAPRLIGKAKRLCACGRRLGDCPVWCRVLPVITRQGKAADRETHAAVLKAILATTPHRIIVDGSKTARSNALRPLYLSRRLSVPITLVHVIRDPRAVLWSVLRDRARVERKIAVSQQVLLALRIAAAWWAANLAAELVGMLRRGTTISVGYERAVRSGVPAELHPWLGAGPLEGAELADRSGNHHAIAGNRMRHRKAETVRLDEEWRTLLHPVVGLIVLILCLPLILRYGLLHRVPPPVGRNE